MLRVELRTAGMPTVVLGSQETLVFGRAPHATLPEEEASSTLQVTTLALPQSTPHTSRILGELVVGEDIVRLRWHGSTEAQLSSLFEAPGGARRVTLVKGMAALLDEGENTVGVLRGRQGVGDQYDDLLIEVNVEAAETQPHESPQVEGSEDLTAPAPNLGRGTKEWFVALALAEPWLVGDDSYPRPPSNREIYERVLGWHGYAWNLDRPQRVDDSIRIISGIAFGPREDPFAVGAGSRRVQNVRFAIGRRAAEVRLVTAEDLAQVYANARTQQ
ncbi:hypothetical protein [Granulicoccus phenolivorans]|uniref:hypothetical protein n=1 Tax=Granulicoccus phenolivorans TaxID=266854 RepID=UPI000421F9BF|nr:hypothetical protein [Granulicoccus phenolivorans]